MTARSDHSCPDDRVDRRQVAGFDDWARVSGYYDSDVGALIDRARADPRYQHMLRTHPVDVDALRAAYGLGRPHERLPCPLCGSLSYAHDVRPHAVVSPLGFFARWFGRFVIAAMIVPVTVLLCNVPGIGPAVSQFVVLGLAVPAMLAWAFVTMAPIWLVAFFVAPFLIYPFMRWTGVWHASEADASRRIRERAFGPETCPACGDRNPLWDPRARERILMDEMREMTSAQ